MFKKFSYLASVSILATSVVTQTVYAMDPPQDPARPIAVKFADHTGVMATIDEFFQPAPQLPAPQPVQEVEPNQSGLWGTFTGVGSSLGSAIYTGGSRVATMTGNILRCTGDQLRNKTAIGELIVNNAMDMAKDGTLVGTTVAKVTEQVGNNEGMMQTAIFVAGNIMRHAGGLMAGETPTLERALRQFWIDQKFGKRPEEVFPSVACGIYLSPKIRGVGNVKQAYYAFVDSWNGSSYTTHFKDPVVLQECFIKGLIRAYAINKTAIDDQFVQSMLALGYNFDLSPATKGITRESVVKNNPNLQATEVEGRIQADRKLKFLEYVNEQYKYESLLHGANEQRQAMIAPAPVAIKPLETVPEIKAIVSAPASVPDFQQSLLMWEAWKGEGKNDGKKDKPVPNEVKIDGLSVD